MSIKIRLARRGGKKRPFYHVVIADSRSPRDGKFIENVGQYAPLLNNDDPKRVVLNQERVKYWLGVGAQPTDRVKLLMTQAGVV